MRWILDLDACTRKIIEAGGRGQAWSYQLDGTGKSIGVYPLAQMKNDDMMKMRPVPFLPSSSSISRVALRIKSTAAQLKKLSFARRKYVAQYVVKSESRSRAAFIVRDARFVAGFFF